MSLRGGAAKLAALEMPENALLGLLCFELTSTEAIGRGRSVVAVPDGSISAPEHYSEMNREKAAMRLLHLAVVAWLGLCGSASAQKVQPSVPFIGQVLIF